MLSILFNCLVVLVLSAKLGTKNDNCSFCQFLVETFEEGLRKTALHHFAGGDTAWEEKNLGKYATSETRLIEVMESVCNERKLTKPTKFKGLTGLEFKCSLLLEENESHIEDYYYKYQSVNMSEWLCISQLKVCCPDGHFGKQCRICPGVEKGAVACYGRGKCHGDGSRQGSGQCKCDEGYTGKMCEQCSEGYYVRSKTELSIVCEKCDVACMKGCLTSGPIGCNECRPGWDKDVKLGCVDIDECDDKSKCSNKNEICVNVPGSYTCECESDYKREGEECVLDIEAQPYRMLVSPNVFLRVLSMSSLACIIAFVIWRRSILLMLLTGIAVFLIIVIEVNVNPDSNLKTPQYFGY